jgi:glutathione S-transferase
VHGTPATAEEYQAWEVELGSRIDVTGRGRRAIRAMAEGDQRAPEYAALNPNLKMPMLEDDGFVLWESNAILFYLANKRPQSGLWPGEARAQADVSRWLAWRSAHWDAESCGMVAFQKASESVLGLGPADPAFTHAENRISRASLPYLMNRFGNACGLLAILSP